MTDLESMITEIRARARAQVSELVYDDISDNLDEEMLRTCNTPAVFILVRRPSARGRIPGQRDQIVEIEVQAGIVVQNVSSRSGGMKGAKGITALTQKTIKALHFWKPAAALEKLRFTGDDDVVREGSRLAQALRFRSSIHETYS